jgi:hypothetical protein
MLFQFFLRAACFRLEFVGPYLGFWERSAEPSLLRHGLRGNSGKNKKANDDGQDYE